MHSTFHRNQSPPRRFLRPRAAVSSWLRVQSRSDDRTLPQSAVAAQHDNSHAARQRAKLRDGRPAAVQRRVPGGGRRLLTRDPPTRGLRPAGQGSQRVRAVIWAAGRLGRVLR